MPSPSSRSAAPDPAAHHEALRPPRPHRFVVCLGYKSGRSSSPSSATMSRARLHREHRMRGPADLPPSTRSRDDFAVTLADTGHETGRRLQLGAEVRRQRDVHRRPTATAWAVSSEALMAFHRPMTARDRDGVHPSPGTASWASRAEGGRVQREADDPKGRQRRVFRLRARGLRLPDRESDLTLEQAPLQTWPVTASSPSTVTRTSDRHGHVPRARRAEPPLGHRRRPVEGLGPLSTVARG